MKLRKKSGEVSKASNKQKAVHKSEHWKRSLAPYTRSPYKKTPENIKKDIEDYIKKFQEDVKKIRKRIYNK